MVGHAAVVCVVVIRAIWLLLMFARGRRAKIPRAAPRSWQETLILTWGGMRGLATLALALAIPAVGADGEPLGARSAVAHIRQKSRVEDLPEEAAARLEQLPRRSVR